MAIGQRIASLEKRRAWLDHILLAEMQHPHPNDLLVCQIKKSKLLLKDDLTLLQARERATQNGQDNQQDSPAFPQH